MMARVLLLERVTYRGRAAATEMKSANANVSRNGRVKPGRPQPPLPARPRIAPGFYANPEG